MLVNDDAVWSLSAMERTIPLLRQSGHQVEGLWLCPDRLGRNTGLRIPFWYARVFGLADFVRLGVFAVISKIRRLIGGMTGDRARSFSQLARKTGLTLEGCDGANDPRFISWLKEKEVDVLLILVGHILKAEVLQAVRLGVINKHAAVLPANKGLLPYFWARLHDRPQGVSFHIVDTGIDTGPLLVQERIQDPAHLASLIRFYVEVFRQYPQSVREAVDRLEGGDSLALDREIEPSYHSLPTREDVKQFKQVGGRIVRWRDIRLALEL